MISYWLYRLAAGLLPVGLNMTDAGADQSPQVADAVGIEWELVKFSDPNVGGCDLFANDAGSESLGMPISSPRVRSIGQESCWRILPPMGSAMVRSP